MRASFVVSRVMVLCGVWSWVQAQEPPKASPVPYEETTAGMVEHSIREQKDADASLNAIYRKLRSRLDEAGKAKLRAAEKAWLTYRDSQVAFEGSLYEGGSIRPLIEGNCRVAMTRNRTKELQEVLDADFEH